jgi:hypothetical protein
LAILDFENNLAIGRTHEFGLPTLQRFENDTSARIVPKKRASSSSSTRYQPTPFFSSS